MNRSSHNRLNRRHLELFGESTLFHSFARAVCMAECLPRKELFENWAVAKLVNRRVHGRRVIDIAAGHGLLAAILLVLDRSAPDALCVDLRKPLSADKLTSALFEAFPQLTGRIHYQQQDLANVAVNADDLVVCVHGCGGLSDRVLELAIASRAAVAILPCCHRHGSSGTHGLGGWLSPDLAIDVRRAQLLSDSGYRIHTHTIPEEITPKNRLLIGVPYGSPPAAL